VSSNRSFYFQVLESRISPTNVAENVDSNTLSGTTVAESESHATVLADSKSCILNVEMHTLTNRKLSVTNTGTGKRFSWRLQVSLEDAPLVNITDSVIHPVKNSASVSAVDVGTADMSSINVTLRKSILIPLKIQVIVLECYSGHVCMCVPTPYEE
jgi:hypothetical protein